MYNIHCIYIICDIFLIIKNDYKAIIVYLDHNISMLLLGETAKHLEMILSSCKLTIEEQ